MGAVELRRFGEGVGLDAFMAAAKVAQGGDPKWVPPLRAELRQILDANRSPYMRGNATAAWVAFKGETPVGRIFASRNEQHLRRYKDDTGHFGFLEAIDDVAVFDALIAAATAWMSERGLSRAVGPLSPSVHYETGLLVDGFDRPPMTGINHAQPYYAAHLLRLGFTPIMDLVSLVWDRERLGAAAERADAILRRSLGATPDGAMQRKQSGSTAAQSDSGHPGVWLEVRSLDRRHYRRDLRLIVDIYNDAWLENWGALPIADEEAEFLASVMRPVIRPDWVTFVCWRGQPIGLSLLIPNVNEAIADLDGRLLPFGWVKFLWRLRARRIGSARLVMVGIRRQFASLPVGHMAALVMLAVTTRKAHAAGVDRMEAGWILSTNRRMLAVAKGTGGRIEKKFQIFERACMP